MRPPLNAGENGGRGAMLRHGRLRFNEAPAERGGKQVQRAMKEMREATASMRPPLNAGEN